MTDVNPGNRDLRNGREGISRKLFGRDKSDDLLQDRDQLADPEHYETAGDGSFDEALDEYYEARDAYPTDTDAEYEAAGGEPVTVALGKHHRRDEDELEEEYVDYEDDEDDRAAVPVGAIAGSGAVAAGAGAAGAAAAGSGAGAGAVAGGVPKRGLAMILIAVALLLGLWGVYAMTKGDSSDQASNEQTNQSAQDGSGQGQGANGQGQAGQAGQDQGADGQNQQDPNAQDQNRGPGNENGAQEGANGANSANGANGANSANAMTAENQTINVYNNSAVPGFADRVAGQVRENGTKVGEVGNIPGESVIFEQNTVLFDPATPGAEDRARELADKVGGIAIPNNDSIPAEAKKPGSLTLVLAENREVNL